MLGLLPYYSLGAWYDEGTPPEWAGAVQADGDVSTLSIRLIDDTRADLKGTADSGWMTAGDYDNWRRMIDKHDYRRAQRHKDGYNAKAQALFDGFTMEEADILGGSAYLDTKEQQIAANNISYLYGLRRQVMTLAIKNNAGEGLVMIGSVVALFPGYGTLIGGVMIVGGVALTAAQKNEMMKRAASEKRTELIRARTRFIRGEITEAQYLEIQRSILAEAGEALAARYGDELGKILVFDPDALPPAPTTWRDRLRGLVSDPAPLLVAAGFGIVAGLSAWYVLTPEGGTA